jgi:DNA mismatch repair protein MutS
MGRGVSEALAQQSVGVRGFDCEDLSSKDNVPSNPSIYREYFQRTTEYTAKYGTNTVVLMQVGAFFEVYGLKVDNNHQNTRSCIDDFAVVCNLSISEKKITFENGSIVMAGFRDYTLDKYIQKLTENGYTAVVFVQEIDSTAAKTNKPTIKRVLHAVYSPGTVVSYDTEVSTKITNHIMCIWFDSFMPILQKTSSVVLEKSRETLVFGVAVANIFTGKTAIFEHQSPFYITPTTFDELERYISIYSPSEIIVISSFDADVIEKILQFSGVQTPTIHTVDTRNLQNERVQNCMKQKYIRHIFSTFYTEETYDICAELHTYHTATQAFCYLMNFIQEHNPNLVRNMEIPTFDNTSTRMLLANHTLKQLNIIDNGDSVGSGQYSSVAKFLNKCSTAIGRRQFYAQLVNPVFDTEWLEREYSMIERMLDPAQYQMVEAIRKAMQSICDVEKLMRQLMVLKVYPTTLYKLWKTMQTIQQLNTCFFENTDITNYLGSSFATKRGTTTTAYSYIEETSTQVCNAIERVVDISACNGVQGFDTNIIKPGVSPLLDEIVNKYNQNMELFSEIREWLNSIVRSEEKNADLEYVKIHETEKSGLSLQITKKRGNILKKYFAGPSIKDTVCLSKSQRNIPINEIRFAAASSTTDEITFPLLSETSLYILSAKQHLAEIVEKVYLDFLKHFGIGFYSHLESISSYIAKMDILMTKTYLAKTYNYCRPNISPITDDDSRQSFVDVVGLRHCLIEHIQQNEIYVSNDISLINSGILLYGTNAVGKTSFIRALGIAVIMAQSGMFVPCSRFVYRPYTAIFSRILGNDNLFRGLSTFAVEMSELRMILRMADNQSMVLGDELCSGTETESALSIFMAGLCDLSHKQASFIFATHFHEILKMDEMATLERVSVKHMAVHYDRELDCLVYDRKLLDGAGNRMYGLEVCKSLHLPPDFLEKAYEIRTKYFPETKGELSHPHSKTYNARKIRGKCEICKVEPAEETHHLQEQHLASPDGFIGEVHKNHQANLMSLCSKCHDLVHCDDLGKPYSSSSSPIIPIAPTIITTNRNTLEIPEQTQVKRVVRKKTTKGYSVFVENELKQI